jgi:hypothetical protein
MSLDTENPQPGWSQSEEYGPEVLCASWNPVVAAVVEPVSRACRELVADLSGGEVDAFLKQLYRSQKS